MLYLIVILSTLGSISYARPSENIEPQNVITVPSNCPEGQELINGQCREIWSLQNNPDAANLGVINLPWNRNVITVPNNCPPGKEFINGQCREVWRFIPTTPISPYQDNSQLELRGKILLEKEVNEVDTFQLTNVINKNIISVPPQCPIGYKQDALGFCRPILG